MKAVKVMMRKGVNVEFCRVLLNGKGIAEAKIVMAGVYGYFEGIGTMNGGCPEKQTHLANNKDVLRDFFNFVHVHHVLLRKI